MKPSVHALLSLWNDITPERIPEYELWHTIEHVAERVWVPGFVSGTRYVAAQGGMQRYFTLYELEDLECLQGAVYGQLVDRPTPWSASMRPSFTNFLRKTGPVLASAGAVLGEALSVTRLVWTEGQAPTRATWEAVAQALLELRDGFATRVRIQQVQPAGPQALRNEDVAPSGDEVLVLLEHVGSAGAPMNCGALVLAALSDHGSAIPPWHASGAYRFASQVRHEDVAAAQRPAPQTNRMPR